MENSILLAALNTISFIYDVITYPMYFIIQQPWNKQSKSNKIKVRKILSSILKTLFNFQISTNTTIFLYNHVYILYEI